MSHLDHSNGLLTNGPALAPLQSSPHTSTRVISPKHKSYQFTLPLKTNWWLIHSVALSFPLQALCSYLLLQPLTHSLPISLNPWLFPKHLKHAKQTKGMWAVHCICINIKCSPLLNDGTKQLSWTLIAKHLSCFYSVSFNEDKRHSIKIRDFG